MCGDLTNALVEHDVWSLFVFRGWRFLGRCFLWSIFLLLGCVVRCVLVEGMSLSGAALIDVFTVLGAGDVVDLIVDSVLISIDLPPSRRLTTWRGPWST